MLKLRNPHTSLKKVGCPFYCGLVINSSGRKRVSIFHKFLVDVLHLCRYQMDYDFGLVFLWFNSYSIFQLLCKSSSSFFFFLFFFLTSDHDRGRQE